ncbi:Ammonium transporter 3 member 3 [Hibiscus syriacus]|uniref:Ammonium transporter 3 member 3 n=1 Tax=Hibiscus syriacus TaxID=106335 RepID=A0A6A3ALP9_HIBSY|nr:Ammonium transporter 3 member 3 [Hibiscus syriacus]
MALPSNLIPDEASPEWLNKGDNAWQRTAATLVGLQSIPGLVIVYGSKVKRKWAKNSAFMAFYAFAMVLVCWVGYHGVLSVSFCGDHADVDRRIASGENELSRMDNFHSIMAYVIVYGCSFQHTVSSRMVGKARLNRFFRRIRYSPFGWSCRFYCSILVLDCFEWGGAGQTAELHLLQALFQVWPFFSSHVCTATSLLTWLLLDCIFFGKPSVLGAIQGMITGLVFITPAAGVVQCWEAIIMGTVSESVPWYTTMVLHNKVKLLKSVDDPIAIFHTHAVAGGLGSILTGFFAVPKLCRLFYMVTDWEKYIDLVYGLQNGRTSAGFKQMGIQIAAMGFVIVLNVVMTSIICWFVGLIVPLRLTDEELEDGDDAVHGEQAFALWHD